MASSAAAADASAPYPFGGDSSPPGGGSPKEGQAPAKRTRRATDSYEIVRAFLIFFFLFSFFFDFDVGVDFLFALLLVVSHIHVEIVHQPLSALCLVFFCLFLKNIYIHIYDIHTQIHQYIIN